MAHDYKEIPPSEILTTVRVRSYDTFANFPPTGSLGIIYIDEALTESYLWDGIAYVLQTGSSVIWGGVAGTLLNQTDLQNALNAKLTTPTNVGFWSQFPTISTYLNFIILEFDIGNWGSLFTSSASGTGATSTMIDGATASAGVNSTEKAIGVHRLGVGTTSTGMGYVGIGSQSAGSIRFASQELRWGTRFQLVDLSTGSETFSAWLGFYHVITAAPTFGAYFRYNHAVNGGRWECCTQINAVDSGVLPTAGQYQVFEIKINTAGTAITYYIDGTLVATITTDISTSNQLFAGNLIRKSAGTTDRFAYIDAQYLAIERLSTR